MQKLILTAVVAVTMIGSIVPTFAAPVSGKAFIDGTAATDFDRRRPRVPGGSGCDSPRDIREHPECRV